MKEIRVKHENLIPQLRKVPLFRHLSDAAIADLVATSRFEEYQSGEYFIHENEIESTVYVILEGTTAVMVRQDGVDSYVATIGTGQVVGEAAIFSRLPRTASVVSQNTSRLMCFERAAFTDILRQQPEAGVRILYVMVHTLLDKLREINLELAFERRETAPRDEVDSLIEELLT